MENSLCFILALPILFLIPKVKKKIFLLIPIVNVEEEEQVTVRRETQEELIHIFPIVTRQICPPNGDRQTERF